MNTTNVDSFFRTDAARQASEIQDRERDNKLGEPLRLGSKALACVGASETALYVAEAIGRTRRVEIVARKLGTTYGQHLGPCTTALLVPASIHGGGGGDRLYTGSWDKTIKVFDATGDAIALLDAHTDFVKSLALARLPSGVWVLVSGSSDSHIRTWSLSTHKPLSVLRGHSRGVECLTWIDHLGVLLSGGSESSIRAWRLYDDGSGTPLGEPNWIHDTSIYGMTWSIDDECLWTASADKTARQFTITMDRDEVKFVQELRIEHPDYVISVLPLDGVVVTGCRDGQVRLFDPATGVLKHALKGHYDAVTGLLFVKDKLVSVSLDGTLRTWSLTKAGLDKYDADRAAFEAATEEIKPAVIDDDEMAELEAMMTDDEA